MYRQGDILIVPVDKLPEALRPREGNVIAEGEATGHAHRIEAADALLESVRGEMFMKLVSASRIVHEEHGPIELPAGLYRIVRQREYSPEADRVVLD